MEIQDIHSIEGNPPQKDKFIFDLKLTNPSGSITKTISLEFPTNETLIAFATSAELQQQLLRQLLPQLFGDTS